MLLTKKGWVLRMQQILRALETARMSGDTVHWDAAFAALDEAMAFAREAQATKWPKKGTVE